MSTTVTVTITEQRSTITLDTDGEAHLAGWVPADTPVPGQASR
ncbi:hypothetical protein [Verrucosispora sp. WMMC514]|nr:hypothetical protein [Verrucosispora sp. WMMC514]WBB94218.1 hypothetical protein O7597_15315 [Verrucosispora sp. WMMC514]